MKYLAYIIIMPVVFLISSCCEKDRHNRLSQKEITIYAVGDIMLGKAAQPLLYRYGYDYPFKKIRHIFRNRDILVGNLEAPVTENPEPLSREKEYYYRVHRESLAALKKMKFNMLCLANNHILDYGEHGLMDTIKHCDNYRIDYFGAGTDQEETLWGKVLTVKGVKIGFIGFMQYYRHYDVKYRFYAGQDKPGVLRLDMVNLKKGIEKLKSRSDFVIVSMHWGANYQDVKDTQRIWANKAVGLGADLVLGHHPHVVQGVEIIENVPVIYSLGNCTFGTRGRFRMIAKEYHYGWIAEIKILNNKINRLCLIPIKTNNTEIRFQPVVEKEKHYRSIMDTVFSQFNTGYDIQKDRIEILL